MALRLAGLTAYAARRPPGDWHYRLRLDGERWLL